MELFTYDVSIKELPLMDTNANSDILTKKQNFERVYTSNTIGDVIRIDFGHHPWEVKIPIRMCDLATLKLFLPFYHKIQKETMIESHWTS